MSVRYVVTAGKRPNFAVDLSRLPTTVSLPPDSGPAVKQVFLGVFWLFASLVFLFFALAASFILWSYVLLAVFFLLGLGLVFSGARRLKQRNKLIFHRDAVEVHERNWPRQKVWREPYANFSGIRLRSKSARNREGEMVTYQIIELVHPEAEKNLPLYVKQEEAPPRQAQEDYAKILGLPALTED